MSRTLDSNINSPFFLQDPTSSALVVDSPEEVFRIDRGETRKLLQILKQNSNSAIKSLDSDASFAFRSIVELLQEIYEHKGYYTSLLQDIREIFSDVKEITPGTVASFFLGCYGDDFPGPVSCNPKCVASISSGDVKYTECEDLILIYSNGTFSSLNENLSKHAYIYVGDVDFKQFTKQNVRELSEAKIETVTLILGDVNGGYKNITSNLPLSSLPTEQVIEAKNNIAAEEQQPPQKQNNTSIWLIVVFFILLVLIVMIMLFITFRGGNKLW